MNHHRLGLFVLLAFGAAAVAQGAGATESAKPRDHFRLSDLLPRAFQRNPQMEVSILTEMSPEGKAQTAPDVAHPAYYIGWDGGLVEAGDVVAGEQPPKKEHLAVIMQQALAASGYLPATKEHAPTVIVHYRWGSYNHLTSMPMPTADTQPATGDDAAPPPDTDPTDDLTDPMVRRNLLTRAALVGGIGFSRDLLKAADFGLIDEFRQRDPRNEDLVEMALGDLYFVVAVAYDAASAKQGKARQLWITKISTNSQGLAMDETLPALASNGRRIFGHETNGPVLTAARLFDGKVEVGQAVVVKEGADAAEEKKPTKK
jgi:hypothetical protein